MRLKGLLVAALVGSIAIATSVASASPTGPTATIVSLPATILPGDVVPLDCAQDDGAGTIVSCAWTVDSSSIGTGSPGAPVDWTATWGSHTIGLTVTDDQSPTPATDSTSEPVTVDNPPTAVPGGPYSYDLASGSDLAVTGTVDDADGSPPDFLGPANWYVDGTPVASASAPTTPSDVSTTIPAASLSSLAVGTHTLSLGVTDSLGETTTTNTTLTVSDSSAPGVTVSVDSPSYTVHQNGSVAVGVTVTSTNGFSGHVDLFLNGANPGDATPTGIHQLSSAGVDLGPGDSIDTTLPVNADSSAAIGTDTLTVVGNSGPVGGNASFSLDVQPPLPAGNASVYRTGQIDFGSSVDAVAAGDVNTGTRYFSAILQNLSTATLTAPDISVDTSTQTFTPAATFPDDTGVGGDLGQYGNIRLNDLQPPNRQVDGVALSTGFDASRSFDTTTIPNGGGDQTVTVSVTPTDSAYDSGSFTLSIFPNIDGGSAASFNQASFAATTPGAGEFVNGPDYYTSPDYLNWSVSNVTAGQTYSISITIHVDNTTGSDFQYKPRVDVFGSRAVTSAPPDPTTSTSVADSILGGTWTFSSTAQTAWTTSLFDDRDLSFAQISPPAAASPPQASANDDRSQSIDLGSSADSVAAGDVNSGTRTWSADIFNNSTTTLTAPQVSVDGASPGWTFSPPVSFPHQDGPGGDLGQYQDFSGTTLNVTNTSVTTGYDFSRSFDTSTVPAGGGTENVTLTFTPQNASYSGGWFSFYLDTSSSGGAATVVGATPSLLANGEFAGSPNTTSTSANWYVSNVTVGATYTLTVQIQVTNGTGTPFTYKPFANANAGAFTFGGSSTGTSATLTDPVLGGTYTFGSSGTVDWTTGFNDTINTNLDAVDPPQPAAASVGVNDDLYVRPSDSSVDSVAATDSVAAERIWAPYIFNRTSTPLTAPTISLDTSSQTFTPAVSFPHTEGPGSDLGNHQAFWMTAIDGAPGDAYSPTTTSTGYDASRSFDTTTIPNGGGDQTVTVDVTPQTYLGGPSISVTTNYAGATITGITAPANDPNAAADASFDPASASWALQGNATAGTTYELVVTLHVDNATGAPFDYKPAVAVSVNQSTVTLGAGTPGSSTTIDDATVGGTFTFSVGNASVDWQQRYVLAAEEVDFASLAPAGNPQANATDYRIQSQDLSSATDSVGSADTYANGSRTWRGEISNNTTTLLTAPSIGLDGWSNTWDFQPAPAGPPLSAGPGSDLGQGQRFTLDDLGGGGPGGPTSQVQGVSVTSGYDASRTFDTTTIPDGGGDQTVTVSITPQDAEYAGGWVQLEVGANWYGGSAASIDTGTISTTAPGLGEFTSFQNQSSNDVQWNVSNVTVGQTYTLTVHIHVDNATGSSFEYKPMVILHAGWNTPGTPSSGTSTTVTDPTLGGTWTFSSTGAVDWNPQISDIVETNFEPVSPPQPADWTVSVDQPSASAPPNTSVSETATVTPLNGFSGDVNFSLSGAPDSSGHTTAPPSGFYPTGPWPTLTGGSGTESVSIGVDNTVADGTYTVYLASSSPSSPTTVFTPVAITVDSTIPVAQAQDNQQTNLTATSDSVLAADALDGFQNWYVQINNWNATTIPGATIHLDTTSAPLSPSPGCPCDAGPQDLAQNAWLGLDALNGGPGNPQPTISLSGVQSGFDASRSVAGGDWSVADGGTQTVTVSVTPQQSVASIAFHIAPNNDRGGPSYGSIEPATVLTSSLGPNEFQQWYSASADAVDWGIGNPQVGTLYTLTVTIDVPAGGTYKPFVSVHSQDWSPQTQSVGSASIADAALGGTLQYGSSNPNTIFQAQSSTITQVSFPADIPAPWSLAIDQPSVSVPAGGSFDEALTITPNGAAVGTVNCSVDGQNGQGGTPSGISWGPSSPISFGPGVGSGTMPIRIDQSVAPGTLVVAIVCDSGDGVRQYQNVSIDVGAAVPIGNANVQRSQNLELPSATDSVLSGDSNTGTRRWWANIFNSDPLALPNPSISLDGYDAGTWTFTPDPGPGPYTVSGPSLGQGQSLELDTLNGWDQNTNSPSSQIQNESIATGYDASRSFDTTTIPTGGGDETVTVSITPQAPQYAGGYVQLSLATDWYNDTSATIDTANVVGSVLTHGEFDGGIQASSTRVNWWIGNVTVGTTYTLTIPIHIANDGPPLTYKPEVDVQAGSQQQLSGAVGTGTTIADALLGGTFSFSSSGQTSWQRQLSDAVVTTFDPMTVQPFQISIDQPTATVQQGQHVDETATLTSENGFAGNVGFSLAGGNDPNNFVAPPTGFSENGDWSDVTLDGTNPATKALSIGVDSTVAPGTYTVYIDSFAPAGGSPQFTPVTITVTAAPPQIHVGVNDGVAVSPDPSVDSVLATDSVTETLTWAPYIFNVGGQQLTNPTISLDSSSQTLTPTLVFPYSETGGPLNHFDAFFMAALQGGPGQSSATRTASTGFDATRSFDRTQIPAGGGTQQVTVSVTPRTATGHPSIDINTALTGATLVAASVVGPSNDPNLATDGSLSPDGTDYYWSLSTDGTPDTTYTVTLTITVPNANAVPLRYKPSVTVSDSPAVTNLGAGTDGPSTTIADPTIGTFTFTVDQTDAQWTGRFLIPSTSVDFAALNQPVRTLDHFSVQLGTLPVPAGTPVPVTVTALDASGLPVVDFNGAVAFSDFSGTISASALTWTNGVGTGTVTMSGPFRNDRVTAAFGGHVGYSTPFLLLGPIDHFAVTTPGGTLESGQSFPIGVQAFDALNDAIPYSGPVTFSDWTHTLATGPVSWSGGVGTTTGTVVGPIANDRVTATAGAASGVGPQFEVLGPVDHLGVSAPPASVDSGQPFTVSVAAYDVNNAQLHLFSGPVTLGDWSGTLAAGPISWSSGVGTATVSVVGPYPGDRITASTGSSPTAVSPQFTVVGPLDHFGVTGPGGTVDSGVPFSVGVTAYDSAGRVIKSYSGPVTLGDWSGTLAAGAVTWSNGVGTTTATVAAAYNGDRVTAHAGATPTAVSGTFNTIGPLTHFAVATPPTNVHVNTNFTVTVTALDALNHTVRTYAGPVTIWDWSGHLTVVSVTWANGVGTATLSAANTYTGDRIVAKTAVTPQAVSGLFNVVP